jgi:hypothetical protein
VEHAPAEAVEVWVVVVAPGDQLAVELDARAISYSPWLTRSVGGLRDSG